MHLKARDVDGILVQALGDVTSRPVSSTPREANCP